MSNLQKSVLKSRLPPFLPPARPLKSDTSQRGRQKDYTPTQWNEYFSEQKDVKIDNGTFRVYLSKPTEKPGPLIVLLHGGGFSALTWSHFTTEITSIINCQCLAIDLRSHGDTESVDDEDLSAETLATDVGKVMEAIYPENAPPMLLIGHSMGGAICVHIAHLNLLPTLIGVTVIDVVEGTAMEALASMQSFLRSRPTHFKSIQQAIEWCVRSGQVRNVDSAKVSMPGQIINCETKKLATNELPLATPTEEKSPTDFVNPMSITEEEDEQDGPTAPKFKPPPSSEIQKLNNLKYTWRIDLSKSEVFWPGWFQGLSKKFLDLYVPKLLLLASIDGLDRTLTVGQMQGKFQMQVLARCGHAVHEDRPHEVAEVVGSFMLRNKFAESLGDFVRQMPAC